MGDKRFSKGMRAAALTVLSLLLFGLTALAEGPYNNYVYNAYDESIPTQAGYLPEELITGDGLGIGAFSKPSDLYYDNRGLLYILDSGNNRVVALSAQDFSLDRVIRPTAADGSPLTFTEATGLCVWGNGDIYIADKGAKTVYILNSEGKLYDTLDCPDADLLTPGFDYKPSKVLVDSKGIIYVISYGCYSGALQFDAGHEFLGFFGSESVTMTAELIMTQLWSRIVPKSMQTNQVRAVPVNYSNFDLDASDIIYTVKNDVDSNTGQVRKLNYYGNNLLYYKTSGQVRTYGDIETYYDNKNGLMQSVITDIDVDANGFFTILDSLRNRLFQFDKDSNLLFVFGGTTSQLGCFSEASAVESFDGNVLVLDSKGASLTVFRTTEFGSLVRESALLISGGKYTECADVCRRILQYDSKYTLANIGLGKAYQAAGEYKTSLDYFYKANAAVDYSNAYYEYRSALLKDSFLYIVLGIIALSAVLAVVGRLRRRAVVSDYDRNVSVRRYPFFVMRHPFKGHVALKEEKRGSVVIATIIVFAFFMVNIFVRQNTSFLFGGARPQDFNIVYAFVSTVGLFTVMVLCNWALATLMDGEGRLKEIWVSCAYALMPYVILMIPLTIISNVIVLDEGPFFYAATYIIYAWVFLGILLAVREVHQFTMKKTILALLGTAFGMLIVAALYAMAYSMLSQLFGFVVTLVNEVLMRF